MKSIVYTDGPYTYTARRKNWGDGLNWYVKAWKSQGVALKLPNPNDGDPVHDGETCGTHASFATLAELDAWMTDHRCGMVMDDFTLAYIECALCTTIDECEGSGGDTLDAAYDRDDLSSELRAKIVEDCYGFLTIPSVQEALVRAYATERYTASNAGHDFWLTRNHHGAGFWDRGLGEAGDELSRWAHSFSSCDIYVGDDEKLYA